MGPTHPVCEPPHPFPFLVGICPRSVGRGLWWRVCDVRPILLVFQSVSKPHQRGCGCFIRCLVVHDVRCHDVVAPPASPGAGARG